MIILEKELVLCFEEEILPPYYSKTGFYSPDYTLLEKIFSHLKRMERDKAEFNPKYKHIVTYVCFKKEKRVLIHQRGVSNEERLKDKYSIGISGHLKPSDLSGGSIIRIIKRAAIREIREEVILSMPEEEIYNKLTWIGIIIDNSNLLGKVHLGIIFELELPRGAEILPKSNEVRNFRFESVETLKQEIEQDVNFKKWSNWPKIIIPFL